MRRALAVIALVLTGLTLSRRALAQGEEATSPRRGTLRLGLAPDWSRWDTRFGRGTPGYADRALEPLAVDFSSESLGVAQLPFLADAQSRVRTLTGLAGYDFNLGRARLTLNASYRVVPLSLELALSNRLTIGVTVPLVRARMEAFLLGPDSSAAGSATRGNVGFNPGSYGDFRSQVDAALLALRTQANSGPASMQAQARATLDSIQPLLCGLYVVGGGNASSSQSLCFASGNLDPSPLIPISGSEAGDSIAGRLERARASYEAMRAAYAAQNIFLPSFDALYGLPTAPLDSNALRRLFSDAGGQLAGDSLTTIVRTRLGDIETGAWLQLVDGPRWRSRLSVLVRWPTGYVDSPNHFIDLGTGDHQLDVEVGLRNDLVLGRQLWVHLGGRYGRQYADELDRRVAPADELLPPLNRLARLRRDLGDYVSFDVVPNWGLDDAFSLGIGYHYYRQGATRYRYIDPSDEARTGMPASVLDQETEITRVQVGAGLSFSTLSRHAAGRARLPYTVTAGFRRTLSGEGGRVPNASAFTLNIRAYLRLWNRD